MNLSDNTILITGGESGIGYELAKLLAPDNKVIICGFDDQSTQMAAKSLQDVYGLTCDIYEEVQLNRMVKVLSYNFVDLDCIIYADFRQNNNNQIAERLFEMFLPLLLVQPGATLINISRIDTENEEPESISAKFNGQEISFTDILIPFEIAHLADEEYFSLANQILTQLQKGVACIRLNQEDKKLI